MAELRDEIIESQLLNENAKAIVVGIIDNHLQKETPGRDGQILRDNYFLFGRELKFEHPLEDNLI